MIDNAKKIAVEQAADFGEGCWMRDAIQSMSLNEVKELAEHLKNQSTDSKLPTLSIAHKNVQNPKENDVVIFGDRRTQGSKPDNTMGTHIFTAHFNQKTGKIETGSCRKIQGYTNNDWNFKDYRNK